MAKVSILMPCFNAAATLEEALQSLVEQSLSDFEVVAIDDGSTDATAAILQTWADKDGRIIVHSQPHSGIVAALNAGLARCRAPYVARMDADDLAHPQRLEKQVAFLDRHEEIDLVSCLVECFPRENVRQGFRIYTDWMNSLVEEEQIIKEMFIESPFAHPSVTFRRRVVERLGGYQDHGWAEDYDLWLRMLIAGRRFAKLPQVLLMWREHPGRLTRQDRRYSLENFLRAKAYYLAQGPLKGRDSIILWGAGMTGRRLSKHLARQQLPLRAFIDVDVSKIGGTKRGLPVFSVDMLPRIWGASQGAALLVAVASQKARGLIRQHLEGLGLVEGVDWWAVA